MQVRLTDTEFNTLVQAGGQNKTKWFNARQLAEAQFVKAGQDDVRAVRNAMRRLVREELVQMSPEQRGKYQIAERGLQVLKSRTRAIDSRCMVGQSAMAAASISDRVQKSRVQATTAKQVQAVKKAPKKAPTKKKAAKKMVKKKVVKKAAVKPVSVVVDFVDAVAADPPKKSRKKARSGNGSKLDPKLSSLRDAAVKATKPAKERDSSPPSFKRRLAARYVED